MSSQGKIMTTPNLEVNDSWFLEDPNQHESLPNDQQQFAIHERLHHGIELSNTTPMLNRTTNTSTSSTSSNQTPQSSFKNSKIGGSNQSLRVSIDPKDEFDPEARADFFSMRREQTLKKNNLQIVQQILSQRRQSVRRTSIMLKSGIPLHTSGPKKPSQFLGRRQTVGPVSEFETFRTISTQDKAKSQRGSVRYLEAPKFPSMTLETEAETPFMNTPNAISKTKIGDPELQTIEKWRQMPMSEKINDSQVDPKTNSAFVKIWTKIILLVQTYNIITCFFFLGIAGFPTGLWLVFEVISEVITLGDFIFRLVCRLKLPEIWKDMTLLHDRSSQSYLHFICIVLASVPQSLILMFCFISYPQALLTLPIGFCRCLKLMGMHNITHYFDVVDLQFKRKSANSWMKFSQMMYFLLLFVHVMACVWLLTNRLDPEKGTAGWYHMDSLDSIPHPVWQEYVDSFFWTHSELSGVGFGNLVPSTNLEWIICSIIEIVGCSIYLGYYSQVICEIYSRHKLALANHKKWEDAKQFALVRKMPEDITESINQYYKFFRMQFDDFLLKNELLAELPLSLQSELTLIFNSELIQSVSFFQLAEPGFILILLKNLHPQICMLGDSVFKADDISDKMYFIHHGQVEILCADDGQTVIANQVKGSYFGEIGILITQRRTATVRAIITSILYYVERDQFLEILHQFPKQGKFLRAVGRQRLKTTTLADLQLVDQKVKIRGFEDSLDDLVHKNTDNYNLLFTNGTIHAEKMLVATRIQANIDRDSTEFLQDPVKDDPKKSRTKPWLTSKHNVVREFIIVPYSLVFLTWNLVLAVVTLWYFFIVPYNIAVNQDINQYLNGFGISVLICDMPFRAFTSIKDPQTYCFSREEVIKYYINKWLVVDLIATMPFDLFLMAFVDPVFIRWLMCLKLLKMARLYELTDTLKYNGDLNSKIGTIVQLICYFPLAGHISACMFGYVGLPEFNSPQRYDGKSLYWSMNSFNWAIQGPADTLSPFELYVQMWYLGGCLMTGAGYGDMVPWALPEILWYTFAMFISDFLIAFSYAEIESYLEQKYQAVEENSAKVSLNLAWMKRFKLPDSLVGRVLKYHTNLWKDYRGINDEEILADLPHSLQKEIRQELFSSLLDKWDVLNYGKSHGLRHALCQKFSIAVYPKNEQVIRVNEIGQEMYFIIQGACTVYSKTGTVLNEFKNGGHFGEMALLKTNARTRGATIVTKQKTTLAVLKLKDFKKICKIYPEFFESIQKTNKERQTTITFQEALRKKILYLKEQQQIKQKESISSEESLASHLKSKTHGSITVTENSFHSQISSPNKVVAEELAIGRFKSMDEYFKIESKKRKILKKLKTACSYKNFMIWTIFTLQTYNFILIPVQFGFRLEVQSYYLAIEAFTIFIYLLDAIQRLKFLRNMHKLDNTPNEDLNENQLKLKLCRPEKKAEIISDNRIEIVMSLLACIPFSVIFSYFGYWDPWWFINLCCTLKLLKMRYTFKVFDLLKCYSLNFWHTFEIIYYYYMTVNYWACFIISAAAYTPDCNQTWLRRVPSPNPQGFRNEPDFWKDTSAFTAYTHAYYFIVSNISQVNIGDLTAINMNEKIMAPFGMIMGAWFYYYITTNIIQMVANLTSASKITTEAEFTKIINKLANGLTPEQVVKNVEDYLEYHKAMYDGLDEEQFLDELPHTLKADILLSRFSEAITKGVLFHDDDEYIDIPLLLSVLKVMKFKIFMPNEFIIKIGQHTTDMMVILDGEANVFGVHKNEFLGTLPCGFHYGNDLSPVLKTKIYVQHLGSDRLELQLDPSDNFDSKSLINLVAKSFVVVGDLTKEDYEFIFQAYPSWRKRIQVLNMFLFDIGRASVEKSVKWYNKELKRDNCLQLLENHITYSTESMYDKIIEDYHSNPMNKDKGDLSKMIKDLYLIEYFGVECNQAQALQKMRVLQDQQQPKMQMQNYTQGTTGMFTADGYVEIEQKSCMDKIVFDLKGKIVYIWVVQLVNLFYIGLMTPIQIGFDIEINAMYSALESISLVVSFAFFIITLRTPVIHNKEKTVECVQVFKVYWSQDLVADLIGLLPLNLILGLKYGQLQLLDHQGHVDLIIGLLRGIRVLSVMKIFTIIYHFQNMLRVSELVTKIVKAVFVYVMINHIVTCLWIFTFTVLENNDLNNWMHYMGLTEASMPQLYLRSFYQITNIVTTTGSGDAFATTDIERIFFVFLMSLGDLIFGICFGYIANYTMTSRVNYENNSFSEKIIRIDRYLNEAELSSKQKNLVHDYFSYQYTQQSLLTMLDREYFYKKLPINLANNIFYHNFKDNLNQLFEQFGSENLVRELCSKLNGRIFLPEDIIIERGSLGNEMYFVTDGVVNQIATDKKSVVFRFFKSDYFGEISIFFEQKRTYCMQAQTFCHLNELQKKDIDEVIQSYPKVLESMKVIAETKIEQLTQMRKLGQAKKQQHVFNGIIEASDRVESEDNEGTLDINESFFSQDGGSYARYQKTVDTMGQLNNALYIVEELPAIERLESKKIEKVSDFQSSDSSDSSSEVIQPKKRQRRLSHVQLGKTLKLKQKTGLRLQWVVGNGK